MMKFWGKTEMPAKEAKKSIPPFWWPDLQIFVAVSLISLFVMTVMMLLIVPMPITDSAGTLLTAMIGLLTGKVATIVDFYFGTSKSSAAKDEAAKTQAQTISALAMPEKVVTATTARDPAQGERPPPPAP